MTHEEFLNHLAADALDSLDAAERRAFADYLAANPEARVEEAETRNALAALAYLAEPAQPSAEIRARLLDRIAAMKNATTTNVRDDSEAEEKSNVIPLASRQRTGAGNRLVSRWSFFSGALAASLIIAALILVLIVLWKRNNLMQSQLAALSQRTQAMEGELARARENAALLTAPNTSLRVLDGTKAAPRARATLALDRRTGDAVLYAEGLPQTPSGKAYQLWFIADGKPYSGRVFTVDAAGRATFRTQVPAGGLQSSLFAVTLEQQSGVPSPTGEKYLLSATS